MCVPPRPIHHGAAGSPRRHRDDRHRPAGTRAGAAPRPNAASPRPSESPSDSSELPRSPSRSTSRRSSERRETAAPIARGAATFERTSIAGSSSATSALDRARSSNALAEEAPSGAPCSTHRARSDSPRASRSPRCNCASGRRWSGSRLAPPQPHDRRRQPRRHRSRPPSPTRRACRSTSSSARSSRPARSARSASRTARRSRLERQQHRFARSDLAPS